MAGGERIAREELERIAARGLLRGLEPLCSRPGVEIELLGPHGPERLVNFSANDYLGLAGDARLGAALAEGARLHGAGAGASRLVCGDFSAHRALEEELASLEGTEAALLFHSGYAANCGLLPALAGPEDVILSDSLNHASIVDGCRLSRARVIVYAHLDLETLERALRGAGTAGSAGARGAAARRRLVVTDAVFSMDGDLAPLSQIARLCEEHEALLVVDEAHATFVLGPQGAGLTAALALEDPALPGRVDARMGTLSKAAGALGAHVAGARALCEMLVNKARPLVFSTALPPALAHAALFAVQLLRGPEGDQRRARLQANVARFAAGLRALGLPALHGISPGVAEVAQSPIFPVVLGTPARALSAAAALRQRGLLVKPIRPPTVPEGTSRLRFALSSEHTEAHLEAALDGLRALL